MTERRLMDVYQLDEWFESDPDVLCYVRCQPEECPDRLCLTGHLNADVFTPQNGSREAFRPDSQLWQCSQCDPSSVPAEPELEPWDFEVAQ